MSNSARTTSEFSDLSAHDRQLSYELFIAADDDGTDDYGFSGDVLAKLEFWQRAAAALRIWWHS